jgi:hypothetical protein
MPEIRLGSQPLTYDIVCHGCHFFETKTNSSGAAGDAMISTSVAQLALYASAAFGLSCFDARLWAYAERYGCSVIYSEDFEHGRYYGSVKVMNPFT